MGARRYGVGLLVQNAAAKFRRALSNFSVTWVATDLRHPLGVRHRYYGRPQLYYQPADTTPEAAIAAQEAAEVWELWISLRRSKAVH